MLNRDDAIRPADAPPAADLVRAAAYLRVSTDFQKYSAGRQLEAIRRYASRRGFTIVRIAEDAGRSGLSLHGRPALQRLLDDVQAGRAEFDAILVYDVSRWGRFQDVDESAHYEYLCRKAGIGIHYCIEPFENDASPVTALIKGVKRVMAGEYSRDLSTRIFAGQVRIARQGYWPGSAAGYGLRRVMIDQHGGLRGELARGERKNIANHRVILVPGPPEEVDTVRWIFRAFAEEGRSAAAICAALNARGILNDHGRPWLPRGLYDLLANEKYIGTVVWNRTSIKLKTPRVFNEPAQWIRTEGAFPALVDPALFERAQQVIRSWTRNLSDEVMLDRLWRLYRQHGYLSSRLIDGTAGMPSTNALVQRFGGMLAVYRRLGVVPDRDYEHLAVNRALRERRAAAITEAVAEIERRGGTATPDAGTGRLLINGIFTAALVFARCRRTRTGSLRWHVPAPAPVPDVTAAVRMDRRNQAPLDCYLLPKAELADGPLVLVETNGALLDLYRTDDLEPFYALCARISLRRPRP